MFLQSDSSGYSLAVPTTNNIGPLQMIVGNEKSVSIIIPTYNRADLIVEAIDSVLKQWRDGYEILVIDDGSTDDTRNKLRPYIEADKIRYLYQANSGKPSVARNNGIANATGKYVCFLDSDDILIDESIEKRRQALDRYDDIAMTFTDWIELSDESQPRQEASWVVREKFIDDIPVEFIANEDERLIEFNTAIVNMIYTKEFVFTSSVMVRKKILETIGGFDESFTISEDRDLWLRIAVTYHSAYLNEPLVYKRRHGANITNGNVSFNLKQDRLAVEKFLDCSGVLKNRCSHVARKQLAAFYSRNGRYSWYMGDLAEARACLAKAAKNYSSNPLTYIFLVSSFLPRPVIEAVRMCKTALKLLKQTAT